MIVQESTRESRFSKPIEYKGVVLFYDGEI